MKKQVFNILIIILIVSTGLITFNVAGQEQGSGSMGNTTPPKIAFVNWTKFWGLFNAHSAWDLEYNNGAGWISIKSDLQIIKDYKTNVEGSLIPANKSEATTCKITLNFTASYTADYRLTFGIDLDVKNYTHNEGSWNYTITYQNHTVIFDFSDIKDLPLDNIAHGVMPVGDDSYFWFRIRKNNIQQGKNTVIDPSFGHYDQESLLVETEDRLSGSWFTCPESGTGESITAYIRTYYDGTKVKFALYKKSDDSFVGGTEEWTHTGGDGYIEEWKTLDFTGSPALTNIDYWLVVWADNYCIFPCDDGQTNKGIRDDEVYNGFPDPLDGTLKHYLHGIYCNYTTGGGPTAHTVDLSFAPSISQVLGRQTGFTSTHTFNPSISQVLQVVSSGSSDYVVDLGFNPSISMILGRLAGFGVDLTHSPTLTFSLETLRQANANLDLGVTISFDKALQLAYNVDLGLTCTITMIYPEEVVTVPPTQGGPTLFHVAFSIFLSYKPVEGVEVEIYHLPEDLYRGTWSSDASGITDIYLKQGQYRYVAKYGDDLIEGNFTLSSDRVVQLEFSRVTSPMVTIMKFVIGAVVACVAIFVLFKAKKKT